MESATFSPWPLLKNAFEKCLSTVMCLDAEANRSHRVVIKRIWRWHHVDTIREFPIILQFPRLADSFDGHMGRNDDDVMTV